MKNLLARLALLGSIAAFVAVATSAFAQDKPPAPGAEATPAATAPAAPAAAPATPVAATFSKGQSLPDFVYCMFQLTFAAITVALITGGPAERFKFSALILFSILWFTFAYLPVAHMVWYWDGPDAYTTAKAAEVANSHAGFIFQKGALDFAGGTVVHVNSGIAALVCALMLGKRNGYGKVPMPPHSVMMTAIGTGMLWMGWFGFNAGSALEANGGAGIAFFNTLFGTATAGIAWTLTEWMAK